MITKAIISKQPPQSHSENKKQRSSSQPKNIFRLKRFLILSLLLGALVLSNVGLAQSTATYTITSTTAVTTTGTAPSGSSATYSQTYTTAKQITSGKKAVLTLSGYSGNKITSIVLNMKSNTSSGAGSLSVVAGSTTIASVATATAFNNANWHGAWSTSYVNITKTPTTAYAIQTGENVVITILASANSLYIQSYTITYEPASSCTAPTSIAITGGTTAICSGSAPGSFTATPTGGSPTSYTYLWYKNGYSTGETGNVYTPGTLTANTNITCAVSTGTGCTNTSSATTVTVNALPIVSGTTSVAVGSATQLTGSGTAAAINPWVSATTAVATVNNTGLVSGVATGSSVITYTNNNGCSNTATVSVTAGIPIISTGGTVSALNTTYGTPSSSTSFSVSGTNMGAGILVTSPTGFEVSTDGANFFSTVTVGSSGTIPATTVYVRLAATTAAGSKIFGKYCLFKHRGNIRKYCNGIEHGKQSCINNYRRRSIGNLWYCRCYGNKCRFVHRFGLC